MSVAARGYGSSGGDAESRRVPSSRGGSRVSNVDFQIGEHVQVWSRTHSQWNKGTVEKPEVPGLVTVSFKDADDSGRLCRKHLGPDSEQLRPLPSDRQDWSAPQQPLSPEVRSSRPSLRNNSQSRTSERAASGRESAPVSQSRRSGAASTSSSRPVRFSEPAELEPEDDFDDGRLDMDRQRRFAQSQMPSSRRPMRKPTPWNMRSSMLEGTPPRPQVSIPCPVIDTVGFQSVCAPLLRRTNGTLFEVQDDKNWSTLSKITPESGWDAHAITCEPGVATASVKVIRQNGPICFGFSTDETDDQRFKRGCWVLFGRSDREREAEHVEKDSERLCVLKDLVPGDVIRMSCDGRTVGVQVNGTVVYTFPFCFRVPAYAKFFVHKAHDAISVKLTSHKFISTQLGHFMNFLSPDFLPMLRSVLLNMLPPWLRKEIDDETDPEDKAGHVMYFSSLVALLTTRSWTRAEWRGMDPAERKKTLVALNGEWAGELWQVIKKLWNDGGMPKLEDVCATVRVSSEQKALIAVIFANILKPKHRWAVWSIWRERTEEEALHHFRGKDLSKCCFLQQYYVCGHVDTSHWFDVVGFWERDPFHKQNLDFSSPSYMGEPSSSNFDLGRHTEWIQNEAGPDGRSGFNCPLKVRGVVPSHHMVRGVKGEDSEAEYDEVNDALDEIP